MHKDIEDGFDGMKTDFNTKVLDVKQNMRE